MKRMGITAFCAFALLGLTFNDSAAQLGFRGVGGGIGYVKPNDVDGTVLFGGQVNLGEIVPGLALVPMVDFFSKSDFDFFSINGNVRYYFPTSSNLDFFATGGLAIVRVSAPTVNVPGFGSAGGSNTEIGLNLGGGVDIPLTDKLVGTGQIIYVTEGEQIKIIAGVTVLLGQ
ncbi:MAG: outer membrane protein [bacterium]